jgi:hypothetical protein
MFDAKVAKFVICPSAIHVGNLSLPNQKTGLHQIREMLLDLTTNIFLCGRFGMRSDFSRTDF